MKRLICLTILFNLSYVYGGDSKEAAEKTAEAFAKTETGKQFSENVEKVITNSLPIQKEALAIIGSIAITTSQGKLNTKQIKNMNIDLKSGLIRPDIEYDFKEKSSSFLLNLNLSY